MNIININEVRATIQKLEVAKKSVPDEINCGIIDFDGAARKEAMINRKIFEAKEQAVMNVHIKKNGKERVIKQVREDLWRTFVEGGEPVYGKTRDVVIENLYIHYGLDVESYLFKDIFEEACSIKEKTANGSKKTTKHNRSDFNRFFVNYKNTLPHRDIRTINSVEFLEYVQEMVNDLHPTSAAFGNFKTAARMAFDLAYERGIITINPIAKVKNYVYYKSLSPKVHSDENKIFSNEEIQKIQDEVFRRFGFKKKYNGYFINGYAILLSIETGMRCAEICALKWADISDKEIWIHAQQLQNEDCEWIYTNRLKHERNLKPDERNGRTFPMSDNIRSILAELKRLQEEKDIVSEYVFCHENGDWIKTTAYQTCLRRLCRHCFGKGCEITNNHAFRMALNCRMVDMGICTADRAKLLGHSVLTNEKYYTHPHKDGNTEITKIFNENSVSNLKFA